MKEPERAYRSFVALFSAFLVLTGMFAAVCAWVVRLPITSPFPFIESEALNRHLFGTVGLALVGIGVGIFFRNRVAWYALLVYVGFGVAIPAVSALDAKTVALMGPAFPILGSLMNGGIGVGLYFALRPAFRRMKGQSIPHKAVNPSGESCADPHHLPFLPPRS